MAIRDVAEMDQIVQGCQETKAAAVFFVTSIPREDCFIERSGILECTIHSWQRRQEKQLFRSDWGLEALRRAGSVP